ncbi:hypothetical protein [Psychrobacillus lasiicapitis]|uniref:Uncharacterized protein n=1 Tax=Psychrobacillus lasiicapitis TaxID=1636719 RepID=A0A544T5A7_9BACI|nr:hypothetical protein [Psychrobacillus lasiicapitis]TQR12596.1 hypothetical protein FG382_13320 [Psychrobacillus lasiicapitis]GGA39423.1 hypothetical protein GCM10011384_31240 [Psychrobacillus lasiicapitis]
MKEPTLKKVAYGMAMAIAIILVHFIDARVYNMQPILALILAILITFVGITFINKSEKMDRKISRMNYNLLNVAVVLVLFFAYFTISQ